MKILSYVLLACLNSFVISCQEPSQPEFTQDALIAEGPYTDLYDRSYSLNPIPINPRRPRPTPCKKKPKQKTVNLFETEINQYIENDKISAPDEKGILFIGSSIFLNWSSLKEQMNPLPVINRSFGGSTTSDILYFTDRIITPYKPKIIVYYAGSNDINLNRSVDEIINNFKDFSDKINRELPNTKIIFLSISKAPQKESKWEIVDQANEKIKYFCDSKSGRIYLDINPLLFNSDGSCKKELFYSDNLHFKPVVYEDLAKVVKPLLESEWKKQVEI